MRCSRSFSASRFRNEIKLYQLLSFAQIENTLFGGELHYTR